MRRKLLLEWALLTGAGLVALAFAGSLRQSSLAGSIPVWAWCAWLVYRALPENRREGEVEILPELGGPTRITMLRGFLVAVSSGFLEIASVAAPAFSAAAILDSVDGRLARARKRETLLGSRLDMDVDAVGTLVACLSGMALRKLPILYVAVGLARYAFVLGIALRKRTGKPVRELDPSPSRRLLAGVQMGFLAVALWPQIPAAVTQIAAYPFGAVTLAMFVRDWLFVSHRLR